MKVTYYLAASLDSFIARPDGDVSWLDELNIPLEETGYNKFFESIDSLVMGRNSYEMIASFGTWPYGDKPTWVCSSQNITPLPGCNLQPESSPVEVFQVAQKQKCTHLWLIGGGKLASSFIESNLLTNISISQMPILLGDGIRLFDNMDHSHKLKYIQSEFYKVGFLQLDYQVDYSK